MPSACAPVLPLTFRMGGLPLDAFSIYRKIDFLFTIG